LAIGLGSLGITSNVLQLVSTGGYWVWLSALSVPAIAVLVLLFVSPILRRSVRGSWLFAALRRTGLIDVEHRADHAHRLPPDEVFRVGRTGPILITGILDQLFQHHRDNLLAFLERGEELRVLILHPVRVDASLRTSWAGHRDEWIRYWKTTCNEAQTAVDAIVDARLDRHPRFQLRFMTELPPYFGMLIGGPDTAAQQSQRPFVRVQPLAVSKFVGQGSVVTFVRIVSAAQTPFSYYAHDLQARWEMGIADEDFAQQRRASLST
jgi:hypothetical protein